MADGVHDDRFGVATDIDHRWCVGAARLGGGVTAGAVDDRHGVRRRIGHVDIMSGGVDGDTHWCGPRGERHRGHHGVDASAMTETVPDPVLAT